MLVPGKKCIFCQIKNNKGRSRVWKEGVYIAEKLKREATI